MAKRYEYVGCRIKGHPHSGFIRAVASLGYDPEMVQARGLSRKGYWVRGDVRTERWRKWWHWAYIKHAARGALWPED